MTDKRDDQTEPEDEGKTPAEKSGGDKTPARVPPKYPEGPRKMSSIPYASSAPNEPGHFSIYKKGQGKWTRIGTLLGAILLGRMTVSFIYDETQFLTIGNVHMGYIPCGLFAIVYVIFAFMLMNKPRNVDFLIATDSEMKKVNWTTRAELWGSTKVVILFMFVIAVFLFCVDRIFEYFFYWIHVLKISPF